jgi:hypothetical protein
VKIFPNILFFVFIVSCNNNRPDTKSNTLQDTVFYPYSPIYTDSFERGNPIHARKVLEIWKQFESGDVRHLASYFTDTITLVFPDKFIMGERDSLLRYFQKRRNEFEDVQCYIDAWLPLKVAERNEDVVFLWGRQDESSTGKKRVYRVLHEIWRFDPSGKIKRMEQYYTHPY